MINWKVRIKNKSFWLALIPAVLLLVQAVAALFGFELDLDFLSERLLTVVNAVFVVLTILGVVVRDRGHDREGGVLAGRPGPGGEHGPGLPGRRCLRRRDVRRGHRHQRGAE